MLIKPIKVKKILILTIVFLLISITVFFSFNGYNFMLNISKTNTLDNIINSNLEGEEFLDKISNISTDELAEDLKSDSYIKWVDFKGTSSVLSILAKVDISSHEKNESIKFNWIELMAYLGCKYGGNLAIFKQSDLDKLLEKLRSGEKMDDITSNMKLYNYFFQSYDAIFHEYIGEYEIETPDDLGNKTYVKKYGLKAFLPIAKNYGFSHYKDFGSARSYGYRRVHLGNDLLGSIGTPIIAVESGYVESLGWNQYGGWRIGIRSFDGKRYYYYAHLRKDHPYAKDLSEGQIVTAGDVIGYLGMTGYSSHENVNNINIPHLHFGVQLIFNEVQKDGYNQIWIDVYEIIEFLRKNSSQVYMAYPDSKDYERKLNMMQNE